MNDVLIAFQTLGADLSLNLDDLGRDSGLLTATVVSLFSDRRAGDTDELPAGQSDKRGWWADDTLTEDGDSIGSRLWLLEREKQLPEVLARIEAYAAEALAWLVEDGHVESVSVSASNPSRGVWALAVNLSGPDTSFTFTYDAATINAEVSS